jgi:hypothetical protein
MCDWVITIDPRTDDDPDSRIEAGKGMHINAHVESFNTQMESI